MSKRSRRERNRLKHLNKKQSRDALQKWKQERNADDFEYHLRKNPGKSELWFLSLFKEEKLGIFLTWNRWLDYFIPDFRYKMLIIEIDDPTHDRPDRKRQDELKNRYYGNKGYQIIRIKGWDKDSYIIGISKIKSYLAYEKKKEVEAQQKEWDNNKRDINRKKQKGQDYDLNKRTRPLTEWEQRRNEYIKNKNRR